MDTSIVKKSIQMNNLCYSFKNLLLERYKQLVYFLGLFGFYWYTLTLFLGPDGHLISIVLLLIAFFAYWIRRIWPELRYCSLFWLALAITMYIILRTFFAYIEFPETRAYQIEMGLQLTHLGGLATLLLVPWLSEENKMFRADWILILITISYLGNIYLVLDWSQIWAMISPYKSFYINHELRFNPNSAGLLSGIILLALLSFGLRWLGLIKQNKGLLACLVAFFLWIAAIWIFVFITLSSDSRSGWIAMSIVFPFSIGVLIYYYFNKSQKFLNTSIIFLICIFVAIFIAGWHQSDRIIHEFTKESETLTKLAHLNFNNLPQHSVGKRISLWKTGNELFAKRPIFGWGPGTIRHLIHVNANPTTKHLNDLHSVPLQLLVQIGIVGTLLFMALIILAMIEIIRAGKEKYIPIELTIFLLGSLSMYIIFTTINFPFHMEQFRYMFLIILSFSFSSQLLQSRISKN